MFAASWNARALAPLLAVNDANALNVNGVNALMLAVSSGQPDAIQTLLPVSDLSHHNLEGVDVFQMALQAGLRDLAQVRRLECLDLIAVEMPLGHAKLAFSTLAAAAGETLARTHLPRTQALLERQALGMAIESPIDGAQAAPCAPPSPSSPPRARSLRSRRV